MDKKNEKHLTTEHTESAEEYLFLFFRAMSFSALVSIQANLFPSMPCDFRVKAL
jgi:hypothetical protein